MSDMLESWESPPWNLRCSNKPTPLPITVLSPCPTSRASLSIVSRSFTLSKKSVAHQSLIARVGSTVCRHIDGIAIGTLVSELLDRGVLENLKKTRRVVNVNSLAHSAGARTGYFQVAMRLLAHQGFVHLGGDIPAGETEVSLTDHGREWLGLVDYDRQAPLVLDQAARLLQVLHSGKGGNLHEWGLPDIPAGYDGTALHHRVALHLHGWLAAVAMKELSSNGMLTKMGFGNDGLRGPSRPWLGTTCL